MLLGSFHHRHVLALAVDALIRADMLDLHERDEASSTGHNPRYLRTVLTGGIPALIYLSGPHRDEWIVSIALWPNVGAERIMHLSSSGLRVGGAPAWGWLNRWQYEGESFGIERFHDARMHVAPERRAAIVALSAPGEGYVESLLRQCARAA